MSIQCGTGWRVVGWMLLRLLMLSFVFMILISKGDGMVIAGWMKSISNIG